MSPEKINANDSQEKVPGSYKVHGSYLDEPIEWVTDPKTGITYRGGTALANSKIEDPEGVSGRNVFEYEKLIAGPFGEIEKLSKGGTVLDLGANKNAAFGRSLKRTTKEDVTIHSLSPEFSDHDLERLEDFHPVRGFAQDLHSLYAENSFDVVFGVQLHKHFQSREQFLDAIREVAYVLKPGKAGFFGPALPDEEAKRMIEEADKKRVQAGRGHVSHATLFDTKHYLYDDAPPTEEERKEYGISESLRVFKRSILLEDVVYTGLVIEKPEVA